MYKQFCVWKSEGKLLFLLSFLFMFIDIFHLVQSNFSVPLSFHYAGVEKKMNTLKIASVRFFLFIYAPLVKAFSLMCLLVVILWSFCMFCRKSSLSLQWKEEVKNQYPILKIICCGKPYLKLNPFQKPINENRGQKKIFPFCFYDEQRTKRRKNLSMGICVSYEREEKKL